MHDPRIIVALDVSTEHDLRELVKKIPNTQCRAKIGKELFTSVGPLAIEICHEAGFEVFSWISSFTIFRIHVQKPFGRRSLGRLDDLNVHCSGGTDMLRAAREILEGENHRLRLIGVTVLTVYRKWGYKSLVYRVILSHKLIIWPALLIPAG